MDVYNLEEQEQIDELRDWWRQHGNLLLNLLLAVFSVLIAWQGWNWYQRRQLAQASVIYHSLQDAVQKRDMVRVKAASGELLEKFGSASYASLGALMAASAFAESGDVKTARAQLKWVADRNKDELRDLARLRLVALLIDEKLYDEAMKQLEGSVLPVFDARFQDTRGDILKIQGKLDEARKAYQMALTRLEETRKTSGGLDLLQDWQIQSDEIYREIVRQKLDALGGGQ
ncbi:MAG: tetratricopeptide repeat protein [Candidatus Accumulibacter sp.]|jgi:predicted negative regulator of RcsB-dependent stress response|nr:tetratricopeptide repeat protein [Accumulibacter sp.]